MSKKTEKLFKDYEDACTAIAEAFLNKQFGEDGEPPITVDNYGVWWVDVGSVLCYNETYYYDFADILTDLKENATKGELDKYNEWAARCMELGIEPKCNYLAWLRGAPHITDEALGRLEKMKRELEDEIKKANGASTNLRGV